MKDWTRPKPFTAEEWNEKLGITSGKQIAEFLASFSEDLSELKPAVVELEKKVVVALANIGMDISSGTNAAGLGNVEVVSIEELNDVSPSLGIPDFVSISLIHPDDLCDHVNKKFFNGWRDELRAREIYEKLCDMVWKNFLGKDCLGIGTRNRDFERFCLISHGKNFQWKFLQILMNSAFDSFIALLFAKLALLILNREEESKKLDLIMDLYRNGNLPIGKMKDDKTFIVLVK